MTSYFVWVTIEQIRDGRYSRRDINGCQPNTSNSFFFWHCFQSARSLSCGDLKNVKIWKDASWKVISFEWVSSKSVSHEFQLFFESVDDIVSSTGMGFAWNFIATFFYFFRFVSFIFRFFFKICSGSFLDFFNIFCGFFPEFLIQIFFRIFFHFC